MVEHKLQPTLADELRLEWRDGPPPKPWSGEWFIALTTYGDRVVLTALPEEWTYDFKTADETYIMASKVAKWMQFPDSEYIAPASDALEAIAAENAKLRGLLTEAAAFVECEKETCAEMGESDGEGIAFDLLARITAALKEPRS